MIKFWGNKKSKAFGNKFKGIKFGKKVSSKPFEHFIIKKKDLNWKQAKKRYPKMNPLGDYDKDGVRNWMDCKPFDKKRQGFEHQYSFGGNHYKKIKTVKMSPELFLRTTYGEVKRRGSDTGYGPYKDDLYRGADGIIHKGKHWTHINGRPAPYPRRKKQTGIKRRILGKDEYGQHVPIPFLTFNEKGKAIGHEGRHTALTAQKMGIKHIPVTIERPKDTKLSAKYETLQPVEGKGWEDYNKPPYDRKSSTINVEDLEEIDEEYRGGETSEVPEKDSQESYFAEKMRRLREIKAEKQEMRELEEMRETMDDKAEERQEEQDNEFEEDYDIEEERREE